MNGFALQFAFHQAVIGRRLPVYQHFLAASSSYSLGDWIFLSVI